MIDENCQRIVRGQYVGESRMSLASLIAGLLITTLFLTMIYSSPTPDKREGSDD